MYIFNSLGLLTSIRDEHGNVHTLTYTPERRLSEVSDGLGRTLTLNYDGTGVFESVTDGTRTVSFTHVDSNLTQITDVRGKITTFAYASGGLMTSPSRRNTVKNAHIKV